MLCFPIQGHLVVACCVSWTGNSFDLSCSCPCHAPMQTTSSAIQLLTPATAFLTRWLPIMFVPSLCNLPTVAPLVTRQEITLLMGLLVFRYEVSSAFASTVAGVGAESGSCPCSCWTELKTSGLMLVHTACRNMHPRLLSTLLQHWVPTP